MNRITRARPVTDQAVFEKLEKAFSVSVPERTKQFLLSSSRGCPVQTEFSAGGSGYHLSRFLSASAADRLNLFSAAMMVQDLSGGQTLLPFAETGFGDFYCLGFAAGSLSGVFYLDHEAETVSKLFDRFEEFLRAMRLPE